MTVAWRRCQSTFYDFRLPTQNIYLFGWLCISNSKVV